MPLGFPADVTAPALPSTLQPPAPGNTTVVPRTGADAAAQDGAPPVQVRLVALLTADGQKIDRDIVWRVFRDDADKATVILKQIQKDFPDTKQAGQVDNVLAGFEKQAAGLS